MSLPALHYRRPGLAPGDIFRLFLLLSPLLVLALLLRQPARDPAFEVPRFHFAIVTLAAAAAAAVALVVLAIGERLRDVRAFYLGLGFCAIAGFFFIHGLLTPGILLKKFTTGIGWAPIFGLLLGSICLLLSTVRPRSREEPWVFRHRRVFVALLVLSWLVFMTVSVSVPEFLEYHPTSLSTLLSSPEGEHHTAAPAVSEYDEYSGVGTTHTEAPQPEPWLAGTMVILTAGFLGLATRRYARTYRLSRLPLHATVVAGLVLLIESLFSFSFASVWRVSWWEYHALVLLGAGVVLYGLASDYRRGVSLTETVSTLFLSGSVEALEHSYSEVLTALVSAVEAKDPYTKGHSEKVARLAVRLGEALGLSPETLRVLYQAGLLHDIGKIGIPDAILNKQERLDEGEFALVRGHPARSEEMVGRIPSLRSTLRAIRWHHERLDGSGYPDGLAGDEVPLEARVLAVADVFDAMSSGRSYRAAWPATAVVDYLRQNGGSQFDSRCVDALTTVVEAQQRATARASLFESTVPTG